MIDPKGFRNNNATFFYIILLLLCTAGLYQGTGKYIKKITLLA